jgi:hypothetical protein
MNMISRLMAVGMPVDNAHLVVQRLRELPNGCVHWLGAHDGNGFPVFGITKDKIKVAQYKVHRLVFSAHNPGLQMTGRKVRQRCNDRGCCQIEHLQ